MATETDLKDRENLNPAHNPGDEAMHELIDRSYPLKEQEQLKKTTDAGSSSANTELKQGGNSTKYQSDSTDRSPMERLKNLGGKFSLRKRRTKAVIISTIVAAITGGGFFIAPNFAVIHLKEILIDDYNYVSKATGEMQLRVLGKQLSDRSTNCVIEKYVCRKYSGLSARQVKMFQEAGLELKDVKERPIGCSRIKKELCRYRPSTIVFQGKEYSPQAFARELRQGKNLQLIAAVRSGFKPRWVAFASKSFDKVRQKYKLSKEPQVGVSEDEIVEEIEEKIQAANPLTDDGKTIEERDGKYYDSDGNEVPRSVAEGYEQIKKVDSEIKDLGDPKKTALSGVVNVAWSALSATKAVSIPCQAYNILKLTSLGFKIAAASTFVVTTWSAIYQPADTLKLGQGLLLPTMLAAGSKIFTPDKAGNTAFDTPHYESMVHKVPRRDYNDIEKRVYGGLSLGLAGSVIKQALTAIKQYTGDNPDKTCNIVLNPWVQGGGLVVGVALAIFSGGTSAIAGAAIGAAAQTAMAVAVGVIVPQLFELMTGSFSKGATGGKLGVMGSLGKDKMHAANAQATGLRALSRGDASAQTQRMLAGAREQAELERLAYSPWDVNSPHTLAGSTIRSIAPQLASVRNGLRLTALPVALLGAISGKFEVKALANDAEYIQWRINECQEKYNTNLATGPDCETEYKAYTDLDPEENDTWLEDNGFIDNEGNFTNKANGDEGGNYIRDCIDRTTQIGLSDETTKDTGNKCIDGQGGDKEALFDSFAAHGVSKTVIDGMDEEPNPSLNNSEGSSATGPVVSGTSAGDVGKFKNSVQNGRIPASTLCPLGDDWKGHMLYCGAKEMFTQINADYKTRFGKNICITDSYRTYEEQVRLKALKPDLAAKPGTSNHGFGTALDLCGGIQDFGTPEHEWLYDNGPTKGWFNPNWAQPGRGQEEPWHFEFRGIGGKP